MLWFKQKHDCEIHGHHYEARYDQDIKTSNTANHSINNCHFEKTVTFESSPPVVIHRKYICDVCRYCGNTVNAFEERMHGVLSLDGCSIAKERE